MIFADTDVMIDVFRDYPPAVEWIRTLANEEFILSGFVVAELIQGCGNRQQQEKVRQTLSRVQKVWPSAGTCESALDLFAEFHLSHRLGIIDAFIGQTAVDMGIPLHSFNAKHYTCIPQLIVVEPYAKE